MKILIIFTGGTIGSTLSGDWIAPDSGMNYVLLDRYRHETGDNNTQFDTISPCTMLSENLSGRELNIINKAVCDNLKKVYDGIILTHGTDTLQYTAAALSYAVGDTEIPIMIVSSAYPLSDMRANGVVNFIAATEFIKKGAGTGVFISYKNDDEDRTCFHRGTRAISHPEYSDNIYSIGGAYGFYDGNIMLNADYKEIKTFKGVGAVKYADNTGILAVSSLPCESYSYSLDGIKAVVIRPYHSGTLNTASTALAEFCKKALEREIPIFLVNYSLEKNYETTKHFDNLGITVLPCSAFPAVYMKCWLGVSMDKDLLKLVKEEYGVQ